MKKFFLYTFILSLPLLVWIFVVLIIDPFNYFNYFKIISDDRKIANAKTVNTLLYQTIEFYKSPSEFMLIGDSRTAILPIDEIEKISNCDYMNLSTNAAKMNEIFDLIYFANSVKKLKHVVIGVNFNMFNQFGYSDRVRNVKEIINNPLKYIFNTNTAEVCYYLMRSVITNTNVSSAPPMSKEEFWKWFITVKADHWYGKYRFPDQLYIDLKKLDEFTKSNNIKMTLIIVPHHRQFHDRLVDFGLSAEENKFKQILSKLYANVIDYDYENIITSNKENFLDPVHYNHEVGIKIVNEVWKNDYKIGRLLTNEKK